jgi:hypothetical protein
MNKSKLMLPKMALMHVVLSMCILRTTMASPSGASHCNSGKTNVLFSIAHGKDGSGSLLDGGYSLNILNADVPQLIVPDDDNDSAMMNMANGVTVPTAVSHTLSLRPSNNNTINKFRGFLFRLSAKNDNDVKSSFAIAPNYSQYAKISALCTENVTGITHDNNMDKEEIQFSLNHPESIELLLEVTLVEKNQLNPTVQKLWYYDRYTITLEDNLVSTPPDPISAPPDPTDAPCGDEESSENTLETLATSEESSQMPSNSSKPSGHPSISLNPTASTGPSSSPSISVHPSKSLTPSDRPSKDTMTMTPSLSHSADPTLSVSPTSISFQPSKSLPPSDRPSKDTSTTTPSLSISPTVSLAPSTKPSVDPNVSLVPSITTHPSTRPSESQAPSVNTGPTAIPSCIRNKTSEPSKNIDPPTATRVPTPDSTKDTSAGSLRLLMFKGLKKKALWVTFFFTLI